MSGLGLRVGVDLVSVPDLDRMLQTAGKSFLDSCWTVSEQEYCQGSAPRLAARWAAKEATMKALGRGIGDVEPTEIEIVAELGKAPRLHLCGTAKKWAEELGVVELVLSMSHESDLAIAFVVGHSAPSFAVQ
jgi:holo-[acyl-carrier protein] synthase